MQMTQVAHDKSNVEWTVEKTGRTDAGSNVYLMTEVATGKTKEVVSDPETSPVIEKLVQDHLEMLKRLADR